MPVGGGGKPAGGYRAGKKGSYGCKGYPTVSADGTVHGCHPTKAAAAAQARAIWASVNSQKADSLPLEAFMTKAYRVAENVPGCEGFAVIDEDGMLDQCFMTRADAEAYANAENADDVDEMSEDDMQMSMDEENERRGRRHNEMHKYAISEGDYVMGQTIEGMVIGQVEHVMLEGGTYGTPNTEYAVESTTENPAMAVRIFEEDNGMYYPTAYSIGMLMMDAQKIPDLPIGQDEDEEDNGMDMMAKADTYTPTSGMKAAARRALKWKEDGKATGAGTPVGWGRASDIVAGRAMSLSVVKRMYSFFSRHEVDKKGKDFNNTANPSNGRIMWDAWGGDAGFSWSRGIVERMRDKALFVNFGKDYTKSKPADLFKAIGVGSMVSWNSSGGSASGKITRIIRNGSYNVPGTDVTINGTPDNPAAVIRLYRDGKPTDTIVSHRMNTLRSA
jgi:hypothetical protein